MRTLEIARDNFRKILLLSAIAIADCTATVSAHAASAMQPAPPTQPAELTLPTIPDSLRLPQRRAAYLLEHFWDAMDFADTLTCRNRDFIEQNFVNFASVFPHADNAAVASAAARLMRRAEADSQAYTIIAETAEKYLYEPDSPMCDDNYYMMFLEAMLDSDALDEYEKIRPAYQLDTARKNRTGTVAADFAYVDRNGTRHTLHDTDAGLLLVIFYDPDCTHCMEVIATLRASAEITQATESGQLTVVAVFADGDAASWRRGTLPDTWVDALDLTGVQEQALYAFKQLPATYLLDSDKTVLMKDGTARDIVRLLTARQ